jgi:exodeoxyribonuclease-1
MCIRDSFDDSDPDAALYSGFIDKTDKAKFSKARSSQGQAELVFNDTRLSELYFRFKARNWPESLSAAEQAQWSMHKNKRFSPEILQAYLTQCNVLIEQHPEQAAVLQALKDWVKNHINLQ